MTAQKGKDLLLKVDTNGAGSFATVAGLRARSLAFNAAPVDITDQESAGRWRELLEGAGIKTARISGSGIFKDAASDETLRQYFFNGTVREWQVIVPDLGTVEGLFQIATLEYGGQHDGEVTFELGARVGRRAELHRGGVGEGSWSIGTGARSRRRSTARATGSASRSARWPSSSTPSARTICWRWPSASRRGASPRATRSA